MSRGRCPSASASPGVRGAVVSYLPVFARASDHLSVGGVRRVYCILAVREVIS